MANWCLDRAAYLQHGVRIFRQPYPQPGGTWHDEKAANEIYMACMAVAMEFAALGSKAEDVTQAYTEDELDRLDWMWEKNPEME